MATGQTNSTSATAHSSSTPSLGRRLAEAFSTAKLIEVPGAKTFVSLDNPDAVIEAIAG